MSNDIAIVSAARTPIGEIFLILDLRSKFDKYFSPQDPVLHPIPNALTRIIIYNGRGEISLVGG